MDPALTYYFTGPLEWTSRLRGMPQGELQRGEPRVLKLPCQRSIHKHWSHKITCLQGRVQIWQISIKVDECWSQCRKTFINLIVSQIVIGEKQVLVAWRGKDFPDPHGWMRLCGMVYWLCKIKGDFPLLTSQCPISIPLTMERVQPRPKPGQDKRRHPEFVSILKYRPVQHPASLVHLRLQFTAVCGIQALSWSLHVWGPLWPWAMKLLGLHGYGERTCEHTVWVQVPQQGVI